VSAPLVLISGFGAFEVHDENPSGRVARALEAAPPPGLRVLASELPVSFERAPGAWDALEERARGETPALLLGLGVHPGHGFRLESRAGPGLRLVPRVDVDGRSAREFSRAGPRLSTELDLGRLLLALQARGVADVRLSRSAGGYVCEWIYHHLLTRGRERGLPALFVHVPTIRRVPLERQVEVVGRIVAELVGRG